MMLAEGNVKKATSRTVMVDVAHVDPGIVVDGSVGEMLASRLFGHGAML